jgi:hypothetical protein
MPLNILKVPPGLSSGMVKNIPDKWDAAWFRRFITNFLMGADVRNATAGTGITITGGLSSPFATISSTSSGGGAVTKIAETILSVASATITFSAIPGTYRNLVLTAVIGPIGAGAAGIGIQFNGDVGANYDSNGAAIGGGATNYQTGFGATSINNAFEVPPNTAPAGSAASGTLRIHDYARTVWFKNVEGVTYRPDSNTTQYVIPISGRWRSTAAITSLTVTTGSASTMPVGTVVSLYGES